MLNVYCYSDSVPTTYPNAFIDTDQEYITLHVPYSSVDKYKATSPWKWFKEVVAIEGSGIESLLQNKDIGFIYSTNGTVQNELKKGINIIRTKYGKSKKVMFMK